MKTHLCVCCCALRSNKNSHALSLSVMCLFMQTVRKKIQMYYPEIHFHPVTCFLSGLRRIAGVMGFSTGSDAESRGQCSGSPQERELLAVRTRSALFFWLTFPQQGPHRLMGSTGHRWASLIPRAAACRAQRCQGRATPCLEHRSWERTTSTEHPVQVVCLSTYQPFLPTSPLCPDSGFQGYPGVPPQGSSPSPEEPRGKPLPGWFLCRFHMLSETRAEHWAVTKWIAQSYIHFSLLHNAFRSGSGFYCRIICLVYILASLWCTDILCTFTAHPRESW